MHLDPKFWLAISFFIFLGLMIKYALPAIIKMIDQGVKKVSNDIFQAIHAKEEAEKLLAEAEKYYQESLTLSKKLIADAEIEAANLIASFLENGRSPIATAAEKESALRIKPTISTSKLRCMNQKMRNKNLLR